MIGSRNRAFCILGLASASTSNTQGGSRVPELGSLGSVRGVFSNGHSYRDPSSRRTQEVARSPEIESMILEPPESVQKLQTALQAKAKEAPGYRFYLLYDKLYRKDVLGYAYRCCRANAGAPGVDGQDFADIEKYGEERWLGEVADTLRRKTYRAEAVRRVWIPKADGKKLRPLGIPTVTADYPDIQRVF